jgi:hypothetical protein
MEKEKVRNERIHEREVGKDRYRKKEIDKE